MEELDKLNNKLKPAEPSLSGAYIRSLVKQLTVTSKTKHPMALNPKHQRCAAVDGNGSRNFTKHGKVLDATARQQQQHKKQVRRRLHTSRPYQERPLNMAEARKEIVTALKFHRAAMKQTIEQKQQQQQAQEQQQHASVTLQPSQHPSFELDGRFKSRRNPRIYPSCSITNFSNFMDDFSFSYSPSVPNTYTCPVSSPIAPPPLIAENPNLILPNQTLGSNLNFHDLNNLDDTLYLDNNNNNPSLGSPYSPLTSSSPLPQEAPSIGISEKEGVSPSTIESGATTQVNGGLHRAMDDEGIAEIRSLGEQYQMEWNDTMNLVTSAWWFNIFNNMEHGAPEVKTEGDDDATHNFDELIEFPACLNANESCIEQCSEDYFLDPTLPCFLRSMDIGDIELEAIDREWIA